MAWVISPPASLLGAARPRVELVPERAYTLGPEACELAALAGIEPESHQADALDIVLGVREDEKWAAREYAEILGRQQGKTIGIGLPRCLYGHLALRERLLIWSAHQYKTSLEAFLQARDALYRLGEEAGPNLIGLDWGDEVLLVKVNNTNGEEGFELSVDGSARPVSRWRFVARSASSGRGFSGDTNVVDEAFAYTKLQRRALAPTLLARPNPQSIYLSSPPLDGKSGDVLFALAARAAKRARNLGFRDWGLALLLDDLALMSPEERAAFLDDRANWVAALPALGRGRVTEEAIQQLRDEFEGDDLGFATEVLCMWPRQVSSDVGWAVIREDEWRDRGGATERPSGLIAIGIDSAWPDGATSAISVAGHHGAEVTAQVVAHHPGTGWVISRVVDMAARHRPAAVVLDRRSPAGHLFDELRDQLAALGIDLVSPQTHEVAAAAGETRAGVAGDKPWLRHYDQPELDEAVKAADRRNLGDAWAWARRGEVDISPLTSVTLAVWALLRAAPEPPAPVSVPSSGGAGWATGDVARMGF